METEIEHAIGFCVAEPHLFENAIVLTGHWFCQKVIIFSSEKSDYYLDEMCIKMKLFVVLCLIAMVIAKESKPKKLQIGIKKRVENCTIKSKRGDLLHMHYTVNYLRFVKCFHFILLVCVVKFTGYLGRWNRIWQQYSKRTALDIYAGLRSSYSWMGSRFNGVCFNQTLFNLLLSSLLFLFDRMCAGEKRKLVIPSDLGYGSSGAPPKIPGDATLIFHVELIKIERKDEL